jgi:hypothetical protein
MFGCIFRLCNTLGLESNIFQILPPLTESELVVFIFALLSHSAARLINLILKTCQLSGVSGLLLLSNFVELSVSLLTFFCGKIFGVTL